MPANLEITRRWRWGLCVAGLVALALSVHALSFTIWFDDETARFFVLDRPRLAHWPQALWSNWVDLTEHDGEEWQEIRLASQTWRPLMTASFLADRWLWGRWAPGYHAQNVLIHLLSVLLFASLLREVWGRNDLAFTAAGLFAVHPLTTQPMWILGDRAEAYCFAFVLSALWLAVRARRGIARRGAWLGVMGLLAAALACKEMAITFPGTLLLTDLFAWRSSWRAWRRSLLQWTNVARAAGIAAILLGYLGYRAFLFGGMGGYSSHSHLSTRYLVSVMEQNMRWLWLWDLPGPDWLGKTLLVVTLSLLLIPGRHPAVRWGLIWLFLTLTPVHNLLQKWYLYAPLAGWSAAVAAAITPLRPRRWAAWRQAALWCLIAAAATASVSELDRRRIYAQIGPAVAETLKKWRPELPEGAIVTLLLPGEVKMDDLTGHFFRPSQFKVQSDPSPVDGIVWDLNQTRLLDGQPVFSKLVQSAVRLAYDRPDTLVRLAEASDDLRTDAAHRHFVFQYNRQKMRLRPR